MNRHGARKAAREAERRRARLLQELNRERHRRDQPSMPDAGSQQPRPNADQGGGNGRGPRLRAVPRGPAVGSLSGSNTASQRLGLPLDRGLPEPLHRAGPSRMWRLRKAPSAVGVILRRLVANKATSLLPMTRSEIR
jgi:hypothetical protein